MFSLWNFSLLIYLLSVNSLVSPFHQFKPEFLQSKPEKILVCQEVDLPALPSFQPFRDERLAPIKLIPHSRPVPNVPVCKDPLPDVRILFTIPAINYSTILTLPPRKWTTPVPQPQPEQNPDDDDYYEEYDYDPGDYEYGQGDGHHKPRPHPRPGPVSGTITGNVVVSLVNGTQGLNGADGVSINIISGPKPKPRPQPKPHPRPTAPPESEELTTDAGGSRENYVKCPKRTSDYKLLSFNAMVLRSPACSHYPAEHGKTLRMFCNEVNRGRWKEFDRKQPFMRMCCKAWLEMLKCPSGFQSVSTKSLNDVTASTKNPTMPPDMPKRAVCPKPTTDHKLMSFHEMVVVNPKCSHYLSEAGGTVKSFCKTVMEKSGWKKYHHSLPYMKICCETWIFVLGCTRPPHSSTVYSPTPPATTTPPDPYKICPRPTEARDEMAIFVSQSCGFYPYTPKKTWKHYCNSLKPTTPAVLIKQPPVGLAPLLQQCCDKWTEVNCPEKYDTPSPSESTATPMHRLDPLTITEPVYTGTTDHDDIPITQLPYNGSTEAADSTTMLLPYTGTIPTDAPLSTSTTTVSTTDTTGSSSPASVITTTPRLEQRAICPQATTDKALLTEAVMAEGTPSCPYYFGELGTSLRGFCDSAKRNEGRSRVGGDDRYLKACCQAWVITLGCSDTPGYSTTVTTASSTPAPAIPTTPNIEKRAVCPKATTDKALLTEAVMAEGTPSCSYYFGELGTSLRGFCDEARRSEERERNGGSDRYLSACCEAWVITLGCSDTPGYVTTASTTVFTSSTTASTTSPNVAVITLTSPATTSPNVVVITSTSPSKPNTDNDGITTTRMPSPPVTPSLETRAVCPLPTSDRKLLSSTAMFEGSIVCSHYEGSVGDSISGFCDRTQTGTLRDFEDPRFRSCCEIWTTKLKCSDLPGYTSTISTSSSATSTTPTITSTSLAAATTTTDAAPASNTTITISTSPSVSTTLADWQIIRCPLPTLDDNLLTRPARWGVRSCAWYKPWDGLGLNNYCYTINNNEWLDPAPTDPYRYQKDCCEWWYGKLHCSDHPERDVTMSPEIVTTIATTASAPWTTTTPPGVVTPTVLEKAVCPMPTKDKALLNVMAMTQGSATCSHYDGSPGDSLRGFCTRIQAGGWKEYGDSYMKSCCGAWTTALNCDDTPGYTSTISTSSSATSTTPTITSTSLAAATTTTDAAPASNTTITISTSPSVSTTLADWQIIRCPLPTLDDNLLTRPARWGVRSCAWYKPWDGLGLNNYCYTINNNEWLDPAPTDPYRYQKDCCEWWYGKLHCSDHPERDVTMSPEIVTTIATTASAPWTTTTPPGVVTPTVLEKAVCPMPTKDKALLNVMAMTQGSATCSHYDGSPGDSLRGFCTRIQAGGWKEYGDSYMKSCCGAWTKTLNCDDTPGYSSTSSTSSSTTTPTTSVTSTSTATIPATPSTTSPNVVTPNVLQKAVCPVPTKDTALLTKAAMVEASVTCSHYDGNPETTLMDFCTRVKRNEWKEYSGADDPFMKVCCEIWATKLKCSNSPGELSMTTATTTTASTTTLGLDRTSNCPAPTKDRSKLSWYALTQSPPTCRWYDTVSGDSLYRFCERMTTRGEWTIYNSTDSYMSKCCTVWTQNLGCADQTTVPPTTSSTSTPTTTEISTTTPGLDKTSQCPIPTKDRAKLTWYEMTQNQPTCRWYDVTSGDSLFRFCTRMRIFENWKAYNQTNQFMKSCCVVWTQFLSCPDQTTVQPAQETTTQPIAGVCPKPSADLAVVKASVSTNAVHQCGYYWQTDAYKTLGQFCDWAENHDGWKTFAEKPSMSVCCMAWRIRLKCPGFDDSGLTTTPLPLTCPLKTTNPNLLTFSSQMNGNRRCGYYPDSNRNLRQFCEYITDYNGWKEFDTGNPFMVTCCMAWTDRLHCANGLPSLADTITCPTATTDSNKLSIDSMLGGFPRCGYYLQRVGQTLSDFCRSVEDGEWQKFHPRIPFMSTCCMAWIDRLHCK